MFNPFPLNPFDVLLQYNHPAGEGLHYLHDLPKAIYADVAANLYRDPLEGLELFQGLEMGFVKNLSARMRIALFPAKETVFRWGYSRRVPSR